MRGAARTAILLAIALVAARTVAAQLPPARPSTLTPTAPTPTTPKAVAPETPRPVPSPLTPEAAPGSCLARLVAAGHRAEATAQPSTDAACALVDPVRLTALADAAVPGRTIDLPGVPVLACAFAETFGAFVGEVASPILTTRFGTPLASVQTGPGFQCRARNNQPGGKPSAHGRGLAIDVTGFTMTNGHVMAVKSAGSAPPDRALAALRRSACGWFTTVLSPGSDAFHTDHMHVDTEWHGSSDRYRICQ